MGKLLDLKYARCAMEQNVEHKNDLGHGYYEAFE